jgi:hypothetical protein
MAVVRKKPLISARRPVASTAGVIAEVFGIEDGDEWN